MVETWAVLGSILLVDVLNPVLLGFMVYAAGADRPVINSSAILLGHTVAYFAAGILIALALERVTHRLANPQSIDFVVALLVGVLLVSVAVLSARRKPEGGPAEPSSALTPLKAFGVGAVVNFVGIPFALPYLAALDQILKADLTVTQAVLMVAAYNLLYALPFAAIPVLVVLLGARSRDVLKRVNAMVDRASGYILPPLLGLVGVALVVDAITFFTTGEGLF